jgi:hypothetical protein
MGRNHLQNKGNKRVKVSNYLRDNNSVPKRLQLKNSEVPKIGIVLKAGLQLQLEYLSRMA